MPVVDDVSVAAPSFSPPLEKTAPSAMEDGKLKAALTQSNGTASAHAKELPSDAVTKIKESLKILKASIQGDPLSDPRYVALLKLLRSALDGNGSANGLNSANGKVNGTSHSDGAIRGDILQKAITGEQKKQLLAQIKAFRCLSRNLPVPSEVVLSMGTHTMNQPVRTNIAPFLCPPTLFRGGSVGNNELVASAVRDAMTVAQEREGRIRSKIQQRMEELKVLPTNIVPNLKKQAQIELKQLKLLELQKKIRSEISGEVKRIREFESAIDMDAYRKSDVTVTEEEVDIDSADGEQAKIAMQRKFFNALHYHAKEFKEFHLQKDKTMKKLTKAILQYHKDKEKREAAIAERKKRERIEYLRRNDVEAYEKLLEGVKDERLNMLMKQTGEFLATMGILVAKEKEQGGEKPAEGAEKTGTEAPTTSKTYYTEAHTIKEEIKEQPEMLVGGKLKEYQLAGVQWLVSLYNNKLNGILADEMGLGKTIQTIGLISYLMEKKGNNGPFMIAMPLSTVSNWSNEFAKWAPKINVVCYKGKPSERKQIYLHTLSKLKFNVVLVSFEYVMIDKNELGKIKWEYMILDEGHRIKNKNAKLSTTLRQYQSKHRLLLTGTPLQNDLGELWSLLNFLLPTIFNSVDNFENWFNSPFRDKAPTKKQAANLSVNEEESLIIINRLHQVLRPFLLRRLKSDVESQLPDKVERVLKCSLSAMQNVMYQQIATRGVMMTDPNSANYKRSTRGFNNVIMQLQKICNHPYLFRDEWDVDENMIRTSGKFELMDRMLIKLKATKHRVLIFTQMTHVITIMELYFDMRGFEYLRLDGQTKQEERATLVKEWNRPDSPYFLFVLSTHAGGLGLNLQTADTVIIFDTDWNPHMDLQAQDRAHRIGQTQEVRVFRLVVQNSLEEKILDRASYKLNIDAKIIQAGMFNNNASDEMRREMLEGLLRGSREDKDEDEVVTSNEQLNSALARNDAEFEKFQKMDEDEEEEWRKKNKKGERQSRLITFEELPKWMTEDPAERLSKEKEEENYGKGKRQRSEVNYDDGLTENQFLRMMEKGLSYEDVRTARAKRRDKKKGNQDSSEAGSDEEDSGSDASQSQEPRKKNGEGKKVKKIHIKQKLDEFSEEEEEILDEMEKLAEEEGETNGTDSKSKKGKRKKSDASELSPERAEDGGEGEEGDGEKPPKKKQKVELKLKINLKKENIAPPAVDGEKTPKEKKHKERKEGESGKKRGRKPKRKGIEAIYRNLWQTIRTATDESGRVLSALFMDLPSAEDYPDYYEVIEKPVCMSQIKRKKYALPAEFRQDFLTMFENAKEYNEATSQIYADASTLMRLFDEEFSKRQKELEAPEEPEAESGDDDDSSVANDDTPGGKKKRGRPKKDKSAKKEKRAREAKEKEEKEEKEGKGEKEEEENGEEEDDDEGDGVDA